LSGVVNDVSDALADVIVHTCSSSSSSSSDVSSGGGGGQLNDQQ